VSAIRQLDQSSFDAGPSSGLPVNRDHNAVVNVEDESKGELLYEGRNLVEVAVPNPSGPDDEVHDSRPTQVGSTFRPSLKVNLLIPFQFASAELISITLVLNCLLSRPADYERTFELGNQIVVFSRTLNGIEHNL
jgi:hypothetical protein